MADKLALTDCDESKFYRDFCNVLQNDPVLKRVVKTWVTYDGSKVDPTSINKLPEIDILLNDSGSSSNFAVNQMETVMPININICVDGTDVCNFLNLWSAIRAALAKSDLNRQIRQLKMGQPAYAVGELDDKQVLVGGENYFAYFHVNVGPVSI